MKTLSRRKAVFVCAMLMSSVLSADVLRAQSEVEHQTSPPIESPVENLNPVLIVSAVHGEAGMHSPDTVRVAERVGDSSKVLGLPSDSVNTKPNVELDHNAKAQNADGWKKARIAGYTLGALAIGFAVFVLITIRAD